MARDGSMTFLSFDADTSLRLIAETLALVDRPGVNPIIVRSVRMADRTLVVEVVAASMGPIAVRGEIPGVMGALSGAGRADSLSGGLSREEAGMSTEDRGYGTRANEIHPFFEGEGGHPQRLRRARQPAGRRRRAVRDDPVDRSPGRRAPLPAAGRATGASQEH
jgi:hypothetical protein